MDQPILWVDIALNMQHAELHASEQKREEQTRLDASKNGVR